MSDISPPPGDPNPSMDPNSGDIPLKPIAAPGPEVEAGKTMAILSYALTFVKLPFFLIPLFSKDNTFSLYHARQCLMLWLVAIVLSLICIPLCFICIGVPLLIAVNVGALVLNIFGVMNASKGLYKPMPLIGGLGEKWFGGPPATN